MRALAAGVMVAVLGCVGGVVAGQPPAPPKPNIAEEKTKEAHDALQAALDAAKSANKVLLVTFGSDPGRVKVNEQMLAVPATAGWIARHASTFAVTNVGLIQQLTPAGLKQAAGSDPLVFIDGVLAPIDGRGSSIVAGSAPRADPKTPTGKGSIALAMRLDWTLRSPIFKQEFTTRHEAGLPPLAWPGVPEGKSLPLLARLETARALAKEKKWDEAANAYATAWWETGGNTAAAPVRVGAMAAEMALIAQQSPGAKDRFEGLRTEYARAMNIRDFRQVHEYLILCRVLGDHEHNLKFLDEATQKKDAMVSLPAADLVAVDWLLPRCHWNDPTEGVSKPGAWCVQVLRQCDKLAARKDGAVMTGAVEYGRWLARVEASRRFTWLLIGGEGKDERAMELRDTVVAADGSAQMKQSLVMCALASGQKRPWMKDMLKGIDDAELTGELNK